MDEMIEKVKNGYTLNIYKDKLELSTAVFKFIELGTHRFREFAQA